jgi:hypothetical protein
MARVQESLKRWDKGNNKQVGAVMLLVDAIWRRDVAAVCLLHSKRTAAVSDYTAALTRRKQKALSKHVQASPENQSAS